MRTNTRTLTLGLFKWPSLFLGAACRRLRKEGPGAAPAIPPGLIKTKGSLRVLVGCLILVMGWLAAPPVAAQTVTATIPNPCPSCGISPNGVVLDPVTNQILVPGGGSNSYIWVDGASNSASQGYIWTEGSGAATNGPVAVNPVTHKFYESIAPIGYLPRLMVFDSTTGNFTYITVGGSGALAVNPVTNTIYMAYSSTLAVINGATNTVTTTVTLGSSATALAVNPVTNQIYVATGGSNSVTVIDGSSYATTTVVEPSGSYPRALAVNPVTNLIYVANTGTNNVTVINGATNTVATTIADPTAVYPYSVALNPVTNMVYVTNNNSSTLTVINGATNTVAATLNPGNYPRALAIDSINNKIYVVTQQSAQSVAVIDGATNAITTLAVSGAQAVAVNPITNKIYAPAGNGTIVVIDGATNTTATIYAESNPARAAVNPVTNKIYVTNYGEGDVTVIDGATNLTRSVGAKSSPYAVAVNPVTNKIYVVNYGAGSNNVTVIDGATNLTTTVTDGHALGPWAVDVNPVTNKIYVANSGSNNVTVIDGATNLTTTVNVWSTPQGVAVNPVTNQIYVTNSGSNNVTVIDGATNLTTTVTDPNATEPYAVAVNSVTNTIYVANTTSNNVTVISGATNTVTATVSTGTYPAAVAVNPVTNTIYVANQNSKTVTVINGATNSTTTVSVGKTPTALAVNPATNKIYVVNTGDNNVTVIDGATNSTTTVTDPNASLTTFAAVNPVTGKIYVPNYNSNNVTVITEQQVSAIPLQASINPVAGNVTGLSPSFTFSAASSFAPTAPPPDNLLFQVDTWQGTWQEATAQGGGVFTGTTATLQQGFHIIYAYATDGQEATSTQGSGSQPGVNNLTSNITAYGFLASVPAAAPSVGFSPTTGLAFGSENVGAPSTPLAETVTNTGTANLIISTVTVGGTNPGDFATSADLCSGATVTPGNTCTIDVTFTPTMAGSRTATLNFPDNASGSPQSVSLTGTGTTLPPTITKAFGTGTIAVTGVTSLTFVINNPNSGFTANGIAFTDNLPAGIAVATPNGLSGSCGGGTITAGAGGSTVSLAGASLAASASCTFSVNVVGTSVTEGAVTNSVSVSSSNAGAGNTSTASLTVVLAAGVVSPPSLTFTSDDVNNPSPSQAVTLQNVSSSTLSAIGLSVIGGNPADFTLGGTCGTTLGAGLTCQINVTFDPTATGNRSATLQVAYGAPGSPQTVSLSGTAVAPTAQVSVTSLSYSHNVNLTCPSKPVIIQNNGTGPLLISSITTSNASFTQTNTCGTSLAPNASCEIDVSFAVEYPIGTYNGTLTVNDNVPGSPQQTVPLTGTVYPPCLIKAGTTTQQVLRSTASTTFNLSDGQPSCHTSTITMACADNAPATCVFNPPTIAPGGSTVLTVQNLNAVGTDNFSFTATATDVTNTTSVNLAVALADFTFTPYTTTATVTAGQTASYALTLTPVNGLAGTIQLGCQGAPSGSTCTVTPTSVSLANNYPAQATVTVSTAARSLGAPLGGPPLSGPGASLRLWLELASLLALLALAAGAAAGRRWKTPQPILAYRRVRLSALALAALALMLMAWAACGGGGSATSSVVLNPGTPAGTYALTVTGTFNSSPGQATTLVRTQPLSLQVN